MGDLFNGIFHQSSPCHLAFCGYVHIVFVFFKVLLAFQKLDGLVIIVLGIHNLCLLQNRL